MSFIFVDALYLPLTNDMQQGEVFDSRIEICFDKKVVEEAADISILCGDNSLPIVRRETFSGKISTTPNGQHVVDFGQNLAGGIEFHVDAHDGDRIFLMCGETLDENGNFTQENFQNRKRHSENGTHQMIEYICKEGSNDFESDFTIFGFRYALLDTNVDLTSFQISSFAVYSDMAEYKLLPNSNEEINKLIKNSLWSMKSNFCGVPTDCPTRERAGWTGDAAIFVKTALKLMDAYPLYAKWIRDVRDLQYKDGRMTNVAPKINHVGTMARMMSGSVGWGDACIIVPFALYEASGDIRILRDNYEMMKSWYSYLEKRAGKITLSKLLTGNPYKKYLIYSGFDYGEWCEPGANNIKEITNCKKSTGTAYLKHSGDMMAEIATILGLHNDRLHYEKVADKAKRAYIHQFTYRGMVTGARQCEYVRALNFDLVPDCNKDETASKLNDLVVKAGYHLNTGFLTTGELYKTLVDYGYKDTAMQMLLNDTYPGWMYEIKKGATTIWEMWDGIDEKGRVKGSLNHYSYGAVVGNLIDKKTCNQ